MANYKIYCDESRQTGSKYKLMGGIWIKSKYGWPFVDEFHNLCIKKVGSEPGHIKWTKVPTSPDERFYAYYIILVDLYFKYNAAGHMFFKTIITDNTYDFKHKFFHEGDYEVGFYKLYYHMILPCLYPDETYHLRIGSKNVTKNEKNLSEKDRLNTLRSCLNGGLCNKYGLFFVDGVLTIEPRPAKDRRLIQLADLFMGAVGYQWNKLDQIPGAKKGKVSLANYIAKKMGRQSLRFHTSSLDRTFNIFFLQPKK